MGGPIAEGTDQFIIVKVRQNPAYNFDTQIIILKTQLQSAPSKRSTPYICNTHDARILKGFQTH